MLAVQGRLNRPILAGTLHPVVGTVIRDLNDFFGPMLVAELPRARICYGKLFDVSTGASQIGGAAQTSS
jgi:hypothetical protein